MKKWQQRALIYKIFSIIPGGERSFDKFRALGGGLKNFDVNKRRYAIIEMNQMLSESGKSVYGLDLVEIGSGWHPVLPAFFYAMGASSITMTDIVEHIRQEYVEQTMEYLLAHVDDIARLTNTSGDLLRSHWLRLKPGRHVWLDVWQDNGITYRAPLDFTNTDLHSASVDMIYSNSCLGYIPAQILERIMNESLRILRPGGWMAHDISVYDDYSGIDKTVTPINFLKYSEGDWQRLWNSRLHYQNRFRPRKYSELVRAKGFDVLVFKRLQLKSKRDMFSYQNLDAAFRELEVEELLCSHLLLVAEKPQQELT